MSSLSKMARGSIPSQTCTVLSMFSSIYNKLGSRLCSIQPPECAGDYDSRKLGHELAGNNVDPGFETLKNIPSGVFRNNQGEILGLGAGKCKLYQNPEYFSFHHMSFYDMNLALTQYRSPTPKTGRKPN